MATAAQLPLCASCWTHPLTPHPAPLTPPHPTLVLEDLDLRDNPLKSLPQLAAFTSLQHLEVSYNEVPGGWTAFS